MQGVGVRHGEIFNITSAKEEEGNNGREFLGNIPQIYSMKTLDELTKITHFSRSEVDMLVKMYLHYTDKKLDRIKFRDILLYLFGMTNDILMDRVFKAFDKDNDSWINQEEWICGLSVFLRGTDEEKIQYCFEVYDLNGDGYISREEMFQMLKNCLIKQPTEEDPDEGIKDLVDLVLKKMVTFLFYWCICVIVCAFPKTKLSVGIIYN